MKDCTVKIWAGPCVLGVGVLISRNLVLTCYHVISPGLTGNIEISFPLIAAPGNECRLPVTVLDERPHLKVDLALLQITDLQDLPVNPALCSKRTEFTEQQFEAYGYPLGAPGGTWTKGLIGKSQEFGWIEVSANKSYGRFIEPGFSGGGLYKAGRAVIYGIVNAADPKVRAACFIPLRIIFDTFSTLQNEVEFESAAGYLTESAETDLVATLKILDDSLLETNPAYRKFRSRMQFMNLKENEETIKKQLIQLIGKDSASFAGLEINDHYQLLSRLNFKHQDKYFDGLIQRDTGFLSFVIRGKEEKHGQTWLLNKLIHKYSRKKAIHEPLVLDFSEATMSFERFIGQLCSYLGFEAGGLPESRVKNKLMVLLTKKIETATQFFIIRNAWAFIHSGAFERFEELVSGFCDGFADTGLPHKCIFIFVEEQVNKCYELASLCIFTETETSIPDIARKAAGFCLIDLGVTGPIGDDDLKDWRDRNYNAIKAINNTDPDSLVFTDRNPERLIPELCTQIGINYTENEKTWIKY